VITNQHQDPSYRRERSIGLLNNSDARRLEEIGRHFSYLKCERPSFEALKQGLLDTEARLRLQAKTPVEPDYWLERLHVEPTPTGFLRGLDIDFNPNLNCFIGGRGTGKSATVELIRYIWGLEPIQNETQNFVNVFLPESGEATLDVHTPQANYRLVKKGREETRLFRRESDGGLTPLKDFTLANLHELVPLAVYGQKEILYTSRDVRSQLDLLDRLIGQDIEDIKGEFGSLALQLRHNRERILALTDQIDESRQKLSRRATVEEQLGAYARLGLGEKAETKRLIDREGQAWDMAEEQLDEVNYGIERISHQLNLDLGFLDEKEIADLPDVDLLRELRQLLLEAADHMRQSSAPLTRALEQNRRKLRELRRRWDTRRKDFYADYERSILQLPDLSPDAVLRLERERAQLDVVDRELMQLLDQRKRAIANRHNLLTRAGEITDKQYSLRDERATELTKTIRRVAVSVEKAGDQESVMEILQGFLRGSRLYEADYQCIIKTARPTILPLLALLEREDSSVAEDERIYTEHLPRKGDGEPFALAEFCDLREDKTLKLIDRLGLEQRLQLDEFQIPDQVTIHIDITPPNPSETEAVSLLEHDQSLLEKKLQDAANWPALGQALGSGVSVGQGCTAILSIILLESDRPLLIDQPEDDLDNRFIYDGVVKLLRDRRGQRQMIMATHNPNIPVGGDAEFIVALEAVSDDDPTKLRAQDVASGFIDEPETQGQVKLILEGGEAAFERRRRKYGF
jgi:hypothetical protein